jgi:curved DNA-binding protein CbpA
MGNESSSMNGISREELIEIQKKQIKLEHQNRKIREQLEKTNKNNKTNKTTSIINSLDLETILKNPHIIFGLEPNAPLEEIKPIYKKLVLMFHPDKSGYDSKEHYSIIKKAYNTIVENRIRQEKNEGLANQTMETIRDDREELDRHLERHNYYFETSNGSNFNNSKFNQMFDTHKFVDETGANKGYSDWLKDDSNFTMSQPQVSSKD